MLLESLNALNQAGIEALKSTCDFRVQTREISLVREGSQVFPSLVTLRIKGCSLQVVHLGCDQALTEKLVRIKPESDQGSGLDVLAENFLSHLLQKFDDRNPRGCVENLIESTTTLHTRGVRTFQFRLDTGQGQLHLLVEVPSRAEMALAKGSEFMASMESIYLPADWRGRQILRDAKVVDNFLSFLRKTESDIYLEAPAGDGTSTVHSGFLVEKCQFDDRPALKLITDFRDPALGVPTAGSAVQASVGVGDRSLEFVLNYLAPAVHALAPDAMLPGALFSVPGSVTIGQRRQTFRVPISNPVPVRLAAVDEGMVSSPWCDPKGDVAMVTGRLADLSFSGARIIADHPQSSTGLLKDSRVVCHMDFPDAEAPLQVMGVIRRSIVGPKDSDQWQDEIGLEFLVPSGEDRAGLDLIRQYVLEVQRDHLAKRLQVTHT